jgi:hypothetical protein
MLMKVLIFVTLFLASIASKSYDSYVLAEELKGIHILQPGDDFEKILAEGKDFKWGNLYFFKDPEPSHYYTVIKPKENVNPPVEADLTQEDIDRKLAEIKEYFQTTPKKDIAKAVVKYSIPVIVILMVIGYFFPPPTE